MRPALLCLAVSLMCVWSSSDARGLPLARRAPMRLSGGGTLVQPRKGDAARLSGGGSVIQPRDKGYYGSSDYPSSWSKHRPYRPSSWGNYYWSPYYPYGGGMWHHPYPSGGDDDSSTESSSGWDYYDWSSSSSMEPTGDATTAAPTTAAAGADNETCSTACGVPNPTTRIVGGEETEANEYPWQVALVSGGARPYCGGSIISPTVILTAAHCDPTPGQDQVVIGEHTFGTNDNTETTLNIANVIIHEDYNDDTLENDIALIILAEPIAFPDDNTVAPVCLARDGDYEDVDAIVSGWGTTTEGGTQPATLNDVTVQTMPNSDCEDAYGPGSITSTMICASAPGKDSCQGDSGGPLVTTTTSGTMEQIGIVSWGSGCARPNFPGVYTRVTSYIEWIEDQIGALCTA